MTTSGTLKVSGLTISTVNPAHLATVVPRRRDGGDGQEDRVRFRGAFDHAPIGMALVAIDGRWMEVNGALCAILGYDAEELLRLRWQDLTHPEELGEDRELIECLRVGTVECAQREKRFLRSDGTPVWVQLSVSMVHGADAAGDYFIHQVQDITARRDAERVSGQQALLFNALHDAVVATDLHGRITEWNAAAVQMFGLVPTETPGSHVSTLMADGSFLPIKISRQLRRHGRWSGELGFRRAGGQAGIAEVTAVALADGDASCRGYLVVVRDVTERRMAQRTVRDRNRQLATLLHIQQSIAELGLDRDAILRFVVRRVLEFTRAHGSSIRLRERGTMVSVVASGVDGQQLGLGTSLAERFSESCVVTGRARLVDDVEAEDRAEALTTGDQLFRSAVFVPLTFAGRTIGVLSVLALTPGAFDAGDVHALQLLAGALAATLSSAARFEENEALVTERSEALAALQANDERFRALIEHASDVIAVLSPDGVVTYVSPAVTSIFGYPADEVVGRHDNQYVHPEDLPQMRASLYDILRHPGRVGTLAFRVRHRDGNWRRVEGRASNLVHHGALGGIILNVRDVTESRRMEAQLRQAQKLEAIGQLAAGIAHEINTPTQYVSDNIRFLEGAFGDVIGLIGRYQEAHARLGDHPALAELTSELTTELDRATEAADLKYLVAEVPGAITQSLEGMERIAEIVRSVKAFSHPGGEEPEPTELNREIENTVSVSRNEWKYEADVELDLDSDLPPVNCLAGDINQVILNLIVNAAHAIADRRAVDGGIGKGVIRISTRCDGDHVEISVGDTGTGIPEELKERIFEPFFTTKEVGRGTGQGLAIAHTVVVEKHGGSISFDTEIGVGTTFVLRLPVGASSVPQLDGMP